MKTNKDFRKSGDDSRGGGYVKGKLPLKKKKSKRSIYDEIEDRDDIKYSDFRKKESIADYFDDDDDYGDFDVEEFDENFDFVDNDFNDYDDFDDDEY
jgi:hypothetical protein